MVRVFFFLNIVYLDVNIAMWHLDPVDKHGIFGDVKA